MATMDVRVIQKLTLTRYHLHSARAALNNASSLALFQAVNQLQDAVEIFLLGVAEHLNAGVTSQTTFERYFDLINTKIAPKELPFRAKLIGLNKLRINAKHHGIEPARTEVAALAIMVREFCDEVAKSLLDSDFAVISLTSVLSNDAVRQALEAAEKHFANGEYGDSLTSCRKALYEEVERYYDISSFRGKKSPKPWESWFCRAPAHARSGTYIENSVNDPTEYIVLDHQEVDRQLATTGISHTMFWNVWRLTPAVFYDEGKKTWVVKSEPELFEAEDIRDRAEFVLSATVEICLAFQRNREATRSRGAKTYILRVKNPPIDILQKAETGASAVGRIPEETRELHASFAVTGFDGELYWYVVLREPEFVFGYVADSVVELQAVT
jgi:hypothetical protein